MIIKRSIGLISAFFLVLILCLSAQAGSPINDLSAQTGTTEGSIDLQWTAPTGASKYVIKLRPINTITTENDWIQAQRSDQAPLNQTPPSPVTAGNSQSTTITGLEPGSVYGFNIRSLDASNNLSPLSNSVTATAKAACTQGMYDGEGSIVLTPSSLLAGEQTTFQMTYTAGPNGIAQGGKIAMRVPDFWSAPQTTLNNVPGYVSYVPGGGVTASFSLSVSNQQVLLTVTSGSLNSGQTVRIDYVSLTCNNSGSGKFRIESQATSCGALVAVSGSPATVTQQNGLPRYVAFGSFELVVKVNEITPLDLAVRDYCGHEVNASGSPSIELRAARLSSGNFINDTVATLSENSDMSSSFVQGYVNLPNGVSKKTVYYKITSDAHKPENHIGLGFQEFQAPNNPVFYAARVIPVLNGITNSSVDTGTVGSAKTVTFTPDGDQSADAVFVRAMLPDDMQWTVGFSSDNFNTITRLFYGNGSQINLSWDGYDNGVSGFPTIAPAGTYAVRIAVAGNTIVDNTLSVTLSAGSVVGRAIRADNSAPISNADVNIYGAAQRYARTLSDGTFRINGLKAGNYTVSVRKPGFAENNTSATVANNLVNVGDISLTAQSILRLTVQRPAGGLLQEVWGNINAHTANWNDQSYATVHFAQGKTTADAGDIWNDIPSQVIDIGFSPNKAFVLSFSVQGLGVSDVSINALSPGEVRTQTIVMQRRPDIAGKITRPSGNTDGLWVSVEAKKRLSKFRRYGGGYIQDGENETYFNVSGLENGDYDLTFYAPGYVPATTTASVVSNQDVVDADVTLSVGGSVSGTITTQGDTTSLGQGGNVTVYLNVNSRTSVTGSYTSINIPINATQESAAYQLGGLSDGTYDLFAYAEGMEITPRGPRTVTISGGSGTLNLTFKPYNGSLSGTVNLPGGFTNYNAVKVLVENFDGGESQSLTLSAATFSFSNLKTGLYRVTARYESTGFLQSKSIQVIDGQSSSVTLNLTGTTYSISGRVTTAASSPFNSLDYCVNGSSPTEFNLLGGGNIMIPANRIMVTRIDGESNQGGGGMGQAGWNYGTYDASKMFYDTYEEDGTYSIGKLPPGTYRISSNGEMDNDDSTGKELVETSQVVTIKAASISDVNFELSDGASVSGSLTIKSGETEEAREFSVYLMNSDFDTIASQNVFLSEASSIDFTLSHIPPGQYTLSASDFSYPTKYWANSVSVEVNETDVTDKIIYIGQAGKIQGQLRIKGGELITQNNVDQILPASFEIMAQANPRVPNGYAFLNNNQSTFLDENNQFIMSVAEGTHDLIFRNNSFGDQSGVAQGVKTTVTLKKSGISVSAGQTKDIGIVELTVGGQISGTITDINNVALPNVQVRAFESGTPGHDDTIDVFTDQSGKYTLNGINTAIKYTIVASPYPDSSDDRFTLDFDGIRYAETRKDNIDPLVTTTVDFKLRVAAGGFRGKIETPDSSDLILPFSNGSEGNLPGAYVIANPKGTIPTNNPLGNFEMETAPDGTFTMEGLAEGIYDVWFLAKGFGSVKVSNVQVTSEIPDIGTKTLVTGYKLSGQVLDINGDTASTSLASDILAVANGFSDIIIAQMDVDSGGTIQGYELSGFKANTLYTLLGFDEENNVTSFGTVTVNSDGEKDIQATQSSASVLPVATRNDDNSITVRFGLSTALNNSEADVDADGTADDSQSDRILTISDGGGSLTFEDDWISSDRKSLTVTYTPTTETAFTLHLTATLNTINSATGANNTIDDTYTFYTGLDEVSANISNASGGDVSLDVSKFGGPAGFVGDDPDAVVAVKFREAALLTELPSAANPNASRMMATAAKRGLKAYPAEMAQALTKIKAMDVSPLSSFYDIFLPAGVSHFFPEGKEAQLCLKYDDSVTDPSTLNIYYFNPATSEYLIENQNRLVDTDNQRICVNIGHASVFTILDSSSSIITGSGYTGELAVLNFPNPFDLKQKTVTLQNPGSAAAAQTIDGTMIKVSVPTSMSGVIEIKIYDVAGALVRTLETTAASSGTHYYIPWDGKNEHGEKIASGTYIGRLTIGGGNEKFFKMAVLK